MTVPGEFAKDDKHYLDEKASHAKEDFVICDNVPDWKGEPKSLQQDVDYWYDIRSQKIS